MTRSVMRDETGGASSVEGAIAAITIGLLLLFGIAAGRLTAAEAAAGQAAQAAARLGSAPRDPAQARTLATAEARRVLAAQNIDCASLEVTVDVPVVPIGTPSTARARVRCAVRWADLGLPGAPGTRTLVAEFTSSRDRYRERP
jgi:Flp pilus assembly protein TadG